ncbi:MULTISPECIES: TIGR04376 family protein [unclassified Microcoleus]|uniref:TIGR04376 family protein n=1 Tax=unclassified Microcoleus TaxID=2642155 RepID=UPI0025F43CC7|nr:MULTISPECIES: TIGR04376 family protein [unclassified Microcoleus]
MSIFDDVSRFLETRLEEFLRSNPHLELQAIEEQLKEQEEDTLRLILEIQKQEKTLQAEILSAAQEIQRWNDRANKAKAAQRLDLAQAAQERQAALLRQGNQRWGQMQGCKERIEKAKELYRQIQLRRKEVRAKAAEVKTKTTTKADKTEQNWDTKGWNQSSNFNSFKAADPLEQKFQNWEAEEELDRMKRNMGK